MKLRIIVVIMVVLFLLLTGCDNSNPVTNDPVEDLPPEVIIEEGNIERMYGFDRITLSLKNIGGKGKMKVEFYEVWNFIGESEVFVVDKNWKNSIQFDINTGTYSNELPIITLATVECKQIGDVEYKRTDAYSYY